MNPFALAYPSDEELEEAYQEAVDSLPDGYSTDQPPAAMTHPVHIDFFADGRKPHEIDSVKDFLDHGEAVITVRGYRDDADLHESKVEDVEDGIERIENQRDAVLWKDEMTDLTDRLAHEWDARTDADEPVAYAQHTVPIDVERSSYHRWVLGTTYRATDRIADTHGYRIEAEPDSPDEVGEALQEPSFLLYGGKGDGFTVEYGPEEDGYMVHLHGDPPEGLEDRLTDNGLEVV